MFRCVLIQQLHLLRQRGGQVREDVGADTRPRRWLRIHPRALQNNNKKLFHMIIVIFSVL